MAQDAERECLRVDHGKGEKANSRRRQQDPERGGGGEYVDGCEENLGEHQRRTGRIDFDPATAQWRLSGGAQNQESDGRSENHRGERSERLGRGTEQATQFLSVQYQAESGDRGESDAKGDRDEQDHTRDLTGREFRGGIEFVTHGPARESAQTDRVADGEAAERGEHDGLQWHMRPRITQAGGVIADKTPDS